MSVVKSVKKQETCLIIGYGDIGQRLSQRLLSAGYRVTAVGRRARVASTSLVELRQCDATNEGEISTLLQNPFEILVITLTPDQRSDDGYRQTYVQSLSNIVRGLARQPWRPRLVLFVSSTSVYGQNDGSRVDESSPAIPTGFSGKRLLEAERLLLSADVGGCVVRFSGIYGPGRRRLLDQVRAGQGCAPEPVAYTNRIHADDCAGVLAHLIDLSARGETLSPLYLGTDCEPAPLHEVQQWLANRLGFPADHLQETPSTRRAGSKRCDNQLLLASGYRFEYPDFRAGYGELIDREHSAAGE